MPSDPHADVCALTERAYLLVSGKDATGFLHAQLSRNIEKLTGSGAPLAGWHDARGRCLALVRLIGVETGWVLVMHESLADDVRQGLGKYVLRSDVAFEALPWSGLAIVGDPSYALSRLDVELAPETDALTTLGESRFIRAGPGLVEVHGPQAAIDALGLAADAPAALGQLARIALGIPDLQRVSAGQYLAQMLDLDRLGAVSFDKGCYPGQEIIARTHHLGDVKRRLRRFVDRSDEPAQAGQSVVDVTGQHIGEVICAAATDETQELLAVVRLSALDESVFLADRDRSELAPIPFRAPDA